MIYDRPLTQQEKKKSQFNYYIFNAINGVSYMCLGETVIVLLAVRINAQDYVISTLGSMLYFGYLLLPLGKIVAAKHGGAYSQSYFWICRNIAALTVAVSALLSRAKMQTTAILLLLAGAFFFYGFRAAGVVMCQPLIGEFTDEKSHGKVLAWSNGIFYCFRFIALIAITVLLKFSSSLWTLVAIVIFGAVCGITSSKFLKAIDETNELRNSAKKPLRPEIEWSIHCKTMRGQLIAGFLLNFAYIMIIPIATLAIKRGYNISDGDVMAFSLFLIAGASIMSLVGNKVSKVIGARLHMIITYILFILCALVWLVMPDNLPYFAMAVTFFVLGTANVWALNSSTHYFLQTIQTEHRVGGAVLLAVMSGVGSGIAGMILAGIMLKIIPDFTSTPLAGYRMYFFITALLLLPGLYIFHKLPKLAVEKELFKRWKNN